MDVFLSYSHQNPEYRDKIERLLPADVGVKLYYDDMFLNPGEDFYERINEKIAEADFFISILTNEYMDSDFCMAEAELAYLKNKRIMVIAVGKVSKKMKAFADTYASAGMFRQISGCAEVDDLDLYETLSRSTTGFLSGRKRAVIGSASQRVMDNVPENKERIKIEKANTRNGKVSEILLLASAGIRSIMPIIALVVIPPLTRIDEFCSELRQIIDSIWWEEDKERIRAVTTLVIIYFASSAVLSLICFVCSKMAEKSSGVRCGKYILYPTCFYNTLMSLPFLGVYAAMNNARPMWLLFGFVWIIFFVIFWKNRDNIFENDAVVEENATFELKVNNFLRGFCSITFVGAMVMFAVISGIYLLALLFS